MQSKLYKNIKMIFQEVDGKWRRVDSQEPNPPTLAEFLNIYQITIDDNTQFCRIKRYNAKYLETIEYRANGNKVTINIYYNE